MLQQAQRLTAFFRFTVVLLLSLKLLCPSHTASGYTRESPQVKQMVEAGLKYLEGAGEGSRQGAICLQGLALVKAGRPSSHRKIQKAVAAATEMARRVRKGGGSEGYAEAVACILLCELDADRYSNEIEALRRDVLSLQRSNGAWSYRNTGIRDSDTSLTQYGMLALWTADRHQVQAPTDPVARAARWLMRTQKQDGGFCYKPQGGGAGADQSTLSLTTAGTGSLYMAACLLGFKAKSEQNDDGLPPALERVETISESSTRAQMQGIDAAAIQRSCAAGDTWVNRHFAPENQNPQWTYYYLYGLERHMSLRDAVRGNTPEAEPGWYNTGVTFLKNKQKQDGSWAGINGGEIDTSLAILFLVRGTQTTVEPAVLYKGILIAGHTLKKNIANATMRDGQVVTPQPTREFDDWLEIIEGAEDRKFDPDALPGKLSLCQDIDIRTNQLVRLRELVSNEDWSVRRLVVKTLASARELDNVPALIYALTDPNHDVARSARDGLRFISRKFQGLGMPDNPTPDQKRAAAEKWKKWYLSIRPDGKLLD